MTIFKGILPVSKTKGNILKIQGTTVAKSLFFKGMTFGFYARNGYYSSQDARTDVDRMAEMGIEWICLVSTVMQEKVFSTRLYRDFEMTPDDSELCDIIDYIHSKGIKVMLRPMIECHDGLQRSHINFPDDGEIYPGRAFHYWQDWFDSYIKLTRHYTRLATRSKCEAYCFDSELDQTVRQNAHWLRVVEVARNEFSGHLTASLIYVSQFLEKVKDPEHWFYSLDSLGSSLYPPAADKVNATVNEMTEFLQSVAKDHLEFTKIYNKPVYFGEIGCCSTAGAARLPYYWENGGGYSGEEQARYLRAVINAFELESWWHGLFWWKWDEQNDRPSFKDDPAGDKGFTIYQKPAFNVFQEWNRQEKDNQEVHKI